MYRGVTRYGRNLTLIIELPLFSAFAAFFSIIIGNNRQTLLEKCPYDIKTYVNLIHYSRPPHPISYPFSSLSVKTLFSLSWQTPSAWKVAS